MSKGNYRKKKKWGGKRAGSGRKALPESEKKRAVYLTPSEIQALANLKKQSA